MGLLLRPCLRPDAAGRRARWERPLETHTRSCREGHLSLVRPYHQRRTRFIASHFQPPINPSIISHAKLRFSQFFDSLGISYSNKILCAHQWLALIFLIFFPAQLKTHIDPVTGCRVPYSPMGRFIDVPPPCPRSDWANDFGLPWWKNDKYCIGNLSQKTRRLRIINTLTLQEQTIEVCDSYLLIFIAKSQFFLFITGADFECVLYCEVCIYVHNACSLQCGKIYCYSFRRPSFAFIVLLLFCLLCHLLGICCHR